MGPKKIRRNKERERIILQKLMLSPATIQELTSLGISRSSLFRSLKDLRELVFLAKANREKYQLKGYEMGPPEYGTQIITSAGNFEEFYINHGWKMISLIGTDEVVIEFPRPDDRPRPQLSVSSI